MNITKETIIEAIENCSGERMEVLLRWLKFNFMEQHSSMERQSLIGRALVDILVDHRSRIPETTKVPEKKEDATPSERLYEAAVTAMSNRLMKDARRQYIIAIETQCDPAGMVHENVFLKDQVRQLEFKLNSEVARFHEHIRRNLDGECICPTSGAEHFPGCPVRLEAELQQSREVIRILQEIQGQQGSNSNE